MDPNLILATIKAACELGTEILRGIPLDVRQEDARRWDRLIAPLWELLAQSPKPPKQSLGMQERQDGSGNAAG